MKLDLEIKVTALIKVKREGQRDLIYYLDGVVSIVSPIPDSYEQDI